MQVSKALCTRTSRCAYAKTGGETYLKSEDWDGNENWRYSDAKRGGGGALNSRFVTVRSDWGSQSSHVSHCLLPCLLRFLGQGCPGEPT